jgi:hypothetical protein
MTTPLTTTLAAIKAHGPCVEGWRILRDSLPGLDLNTPFPLAHILDSNGLDHATWALRVLGDDAPIARLFAADCAEHVLHLYEQRHPTDPRPRLAIEAARQYAAIQLGAPGNLTTARTRMAEAARAEAARGAGWVSGASGAVAAARAAKAVARAAGWAAEAAGYAAEEAARWASVARWASGVTEAASWVAEAASWVAERDWQGARLRAYDDGLLPAPPTQHLCGAA